jgi:hypothetical protein
MFGLTNSEGNHGEDVKEYYFYLDSTPTHSHMKFESAREALRAAIDLQRTFVDEVERRPALPLRVGIGLDAGEAVPVEGGYRGGALNLAARLCSQAGPGQVLASYGVVHLARAVDGIRFVEHGDLELKGLTEPVRVLEVEPEDAPGGGLATRLDRASEQDAPSIAVSELPLLLDPIVPLTDGASSVLLASEEWASNKGFDIQAKLIDCEVAAVDFANKKEGLLMAPAYAVARMLSRREERLQSFDFYEIHEAFAAQGLAVLRQLGIADDDSRVNPNGGAIALGHPLGMSGARLALTATEQLQRNGGKRALATMCIGVGQGIALALERV